MSDVKKIEPVTEAFAEKLAINEAAKNEDSPNRKLIRSWLNRSMKVKITDGRTVIGIFLCTDKHSNLILGSCHEYFGPIGNEARTEFLSNLRSNFYF